MTLNRMLFGYFHLATEVTEQSRGLKVLYQLYQQQEEADEFVISEMEFWVSCKPS